MTSAQQPTSPATYLDNAATTPLLGEVRQAMRPFLEGEHGNPSSVHSLGVAARRAVERAREQVAAALGRPLDGYGPSRQKEARIVFTSGGTEANNLAILGYSRLRRGDRIICSAVEHPSAHRAAEAAASEAGCPLHRTRVGQDGRLDLDHLESLLTERTSVVALIHGQNEYGGIQPIAEAAALVRQKARRAHLHVDLVQSFGKVSVSDLLGVIDSAALSAHKIHGPKGVGALALFTASRPVPLVHGGGQEDGLRSGTENVAGIVGFGRAARQAGEIDIEKQQVELGARLERVRRSLLSLADVTLLGGVGPTPHLPTIAAASIDGVRGEVLQHHLEQQDLLIGTGSACHAGKNRISSTYEALGLSVDQARNVIRISLSRLTDDRDIERVERELPQAVAAVREMVQ